MKKELYIGTSGYSYKHWQDLFYPGDVKPKDYFKFYCRYFNSVELNVTFYRSLSREVFSGWDKKSPQDFRFAVKGPRFITHIKRLKEASGPVDKFFASLEPLERKVICVLWQLPPSLQCDIGRLEEFLRIISRRQYPWQYSFEFRHNSWFTSEIYSLLRSYNICICFAFSNKWEFKPEITADFLYLRFHGSSRLYSSNYSHRQLNNLAGKIRQWAAGRRVLAFFNNDYKGFAVKNAEYLRQKLEEYNG